MLSFFNLFFMITVTPLEVQRTVVNICNMLYDIFHPSAEFLPPAAPVLFVLPCSRHPIICCLYFFVTSSVNIAYTTSPCHFLLYFLIPCIYYLVYWSLPSLYIFFWSWFLLSTRLTVQWRRTFPSLMRGNWLRSLVGSCSSWCRETDDRCWFASHQWRTATQSLMVRDFPNWKAADPILCRGRPVEWPPSTIIIIM